MKVRPYLTFKGNCQEAIDLYKRAFDTDTIELMRFSDIPPIPGHVIPQELMPQILQATLAFGDDYIRMSDSGGAFFKAGESERVSLAVEASVSKIKKAFAVLSEEGRITRPLEESYHSPCHGTLFDKFGVMWNLIALK